LKYVTIFGLSVFLNDSKNISKQLRISALMSSKNRKKLKSLSATCSFNSFLVISFAFRMEKFIPLSKYISLSWRKKSLTPVMSPMTASLDGTRKILMFFIFFAPFHFVMPF